MGQPGRGRDAVEVFYHPNRLGHTAYAELLEARGTFGAPTSPPVVTHPRPRATMHVALDRHRVRKNHRVGVRVGVVLSNRARPRGRVVVYDRTHHRTLASRQLRAGDRGRVTLRPRLRRAGRTVLVVTYRDPAARAVSATRQVRVRR